MVHSNAKMSRWFTRIGDAALAAYEAVKNSR